MRLPRDLSGVALVKVLAKLGYQSTRQTGSHVRLTTQEHGEHHVTIPLHDPLRIGTLANIIGDVAGHFGLLKEDVLQKLFSSPR